MLEPSIIEELALWVYMAGARLKSKGAEKTGKWKLKIEKVSR